MNANPATEPNGGPETAQGRGQAGGTGDTYQNPNLNCKATIAATLDFLHPDGSVFELCIIGPKPAKSHLWEGYAAGQKAVVAGWFRNQEKAGGLATQVQGTGVHVTLNPCQEALLARANERLVAGVGRTKDSEVQHIRNLLIDIDPIRPEGTSSTDDEHDTALQMSKVVQAVLTEEGWPESLVGDSGNGAHLVYPLDLPLGEGTEVLLKAVLTGLARRHAAQLARLNLELDQAVGNPARLTKLYGTWARKGDDTPDRPHRLSRIISLPQVRTPVPIELLKKIAGEAEPEDDPKTTSHGQTSGHFDLAAYLDHYNAEVIRVKPHGGGKLYCLKECIFDPNHTAGESAIGQAADGKLFYQCFHDSCKGRTWAKARVLISGTDKLTQFISGHSPGSAPGGNAQNPGKLPP